MECLFLEVFSLYIASGYCGQDGVSGKRIKLKIKNKCIFSK